MSGVLGILHPRRSVVQINSIKIKALQPQEGVHRVHRQIQKLPQAPLPIEIQDQAEASQRRSEKDPCETAIMICILVFLNIPEYHLMTDHSRRESHQHFYHTNEVLVVNVEFHGTYLPEEVVCFALNSFICTCLSRLLTWFQSKIWGNFELTFYRISEGNPVEELQLISRLNCLNNL